MKSLEIKEKLKDREFRLSLDFQPLDALDLMTYEGLRGRSAGIVYYEGAAIIADYTGNRYVVYAEAPEV